MNVHDTHVGSADSRDTAGRSDSGAKGGSESGIDASEQWSSARMRQLLLKGLVPVLILAAGYGSYGYLKATKPEIAKRAKTERAFAVKTVTTARTTLQPTLKLFGSTVAGRQVDIRALVAGRVIETSSTLREGGEIASGDTLIKIDPFDYRSSLTEARAQLNEARAKIAEFNASLTTDETSLSYAREQLALARTDLERAKPLVKRGTVSRRTVDDRQQIVLQRQQAADQLNNSIAVWTARVAQQDAIAERLQATIARAQQRLDETELKAPFNAYVSEVTSQVGRMVSANDKIATLIDKDWIEARFSLSDEQYGRIVAAEGSLQGRKVDVRWVLGGTVLTYPASIDRVGARITAGNGGVEVFARVNAPDLPVPLRPGAFVEVLVPDTVFSDVIRLPNAALYDGDTVYVIVKGRLSARKVKIAGTAQSDLLVTGDVKPGERVLITRISTPGEGVKVKEASRP